ncbi:sulfotransferase family protein [Phenylobacterium aquaticum]|uniref:sulfotransferase family protein n=1 Tax=Phenylobacterium aquaticum TaxID=1763816 RepID=UPI0026EFB210|nr:hypothetical protein [Phenylobacterium aquaticum]
MTRTKAHSGPPSRRPAYLVLGMHRSGTSAATQLLALAGANLPGQVMAGDAHNEKGYFEPWRIAVFNDARLRAGGGAWDDPFSHPYVSLAEPDETDWRARAGALFAEEYAEAAIPLLKDPRVSVLMPLWRPVLEAAGFELRVVIPVRHPLAVAGSLARRDGFPIAKSVLLWTAYMLAAEAGSRGLPRAFVDYDALLADWRAETGRIEAAHGAPLPDLSANAAREIDAFLSPELRHNAGTGDLAAIAEWGADAQAVFDWFKAAASGPPPSAKPLEAAAKRLEVLRQRIGSLVSPVTRDLDQTRSDLADARRLHAFKTQEREIQMAEALDGLLARR